MRGPALIAALVFAGCASRNDLTAGAGIGIRELADRGELAIDATRVPEIEACAPGAMLRRSAEGWDCAAIDPALLSARLGELEAHAGELSTLEARADTLESSIARLEAANLLLDHLAAAARTRLDAERSSRARAALAIPAAACVPADSEHAGGRLLFDGARFHSRPRSAGEAFVYCPTFMVASGMTWNAIEATYRDPDSTAPGSWLFTRLRLTPDPQDSILGGLDSNCASETSTQARPTVLNRSPFSGGERARDYHYHQVVLNGGGLAATPSFLGLRMEERGPFAPPELAAVGGEARVIAGWPWDFIEQGPSSWHSDEIYLAPGHAPTEVRAHDRPIDQSLLAQPVPELVLRTDRLCDCDLSYQLAVPRGDYRVTLYFVENCPDCAGREIGGNLDQPEPIHEFGVRVEDQGIAGYAPGQVAGQVFRATELVFDVTVGDGVLEITIEDLGPGTAPGDAAIEGFTVRRTR